MKAPRGTVGAAQKTVAKNPFAAQGDKEGKDEDKQEGGDTKKGKGKGQGQQKVVGHKKGEGKQKKDTGNKEGKGDAEVVQNAEGNKEGKKEAQNAEASNEETAEKPGHAYHVDTDDDVIMEPTEPAKPTPSKAVEKKMPSKAPNKAPNKTPNEAVEKPKPPTPPPPPRPGDDGDLDAIKEKLYEEARAGPSRWSLWPMSTCKALPEMLPYSKGGG